MNAETVKWIAALVLLFITFFFTSLPIFVVPKIRRAQDTDVRGRYKRIISLLSCAGGGVFMGTCLLDLFPNVKTQMDTVFQMLRVKQTFPVAEFLLAIGFLIVLIIEQMVLAFQGEGSDDMFHHHGDNHHHGDHVIPNTYANPNYGSIVREPEAPQHMQSVHEDKSSHSTLRSALLVFALSLHSIFEGLAIGLQTNAHDIIQILVAVLIHKSVIAFTLGLNLTYSKFTKSSILWSMVIFSSMSPVGTVVGSFVSEIGSGIRLAVTSGILQGLAAGTFLYVTFFEVLPHEFNHHKDKVLKVFALITGFSIISLLILYLPA